MTSGDWEWRIFWSRFREIDPEIRIPSRSSGGFHILGDSRGALILRSYHTPLTLCNDCISMIGNRTMSEGSIREVYGLRHHDTHTRTDVCQYWSQSQCHPSHRSHTPIRELWRIFPDLSPHRYRYPAQYFPICGISFQK